MLVVRYIVGWFLIVAVLAICISPFVDLPQTSLSGKQNAEILFWCLAASLLLVRAVLAARTLATPKFAVCALDSALAPPGSHLNQLRSVVFLI
jgi:hypothetical protein